jgi:hypothetical protein
VRPSGFSERVVPSAPEAKPERARAVQVPTVSDPSLPIASSVVGGEDVAKDIEYPDG